jgi:uncharacterized protein YeaO (DUF488 family)
MRLWPRGVRKTTIDLWMKDVGTSIDLIRGWKSGRVTWAQFKSRYKKQMRGELEKNRIKELVEYAKKGPITLLCTDKDPDRCHRSLLKEMIEARA